MRGPWGYKIEIDLSLRRTKFRLELKPSEEIITESNSLFSIKVGEWLFLCVFMCMLLLLLFVCVVRTVIHLSLCTVLNCSHNSAIMRPILACGASFELRSDGQVGLD